MNAASIERLANSDPTRRCHHVSRRTSRHTGTLCAFYRPIPTASPMATLTGRCASREPFGQIGQRRIRPPSSNVEAGVSRRRLRGLTPAQGHVRASLVVQPQGVDDVVPEGQELSHQFRVRLKVGIINLLEDFQEGLAAFPSGGSGFPTPARRTISSATESSATAASRTPYPIAEPAQRSRCSPCMQRLSSHSRLTQRPQPYPDGSSVTKSARIRCCGSMSLAVAFGAGDENRTPAHDAPAGTTRAIHQIDRCFQSPGIRISAKFAGLGHTVVVGGPRVTNLGGCQP